ncbi:MAG: hypothetical protein AB1522_08910 [Chloroflexota bacterium]
MNYEKVKRWIISGSILVLGIALKAILLFLDVFPFNADEAIVALMARHILRGEMPIFFYGQAYMGSLDAFLVAGMFRIFGEQVWGIRLVQIILYSFTILTGFWIGNLIFKSFRAAIITALLMAIPPVNTTLYTTVSLGGYGEALLIGNLILLSTFFLLKSIITQNPPGKNENSIKIRFEKSFPSGFHKEKMNLPLNRLFLALLWGFFIGFGLWANGLTLVYSLAAVAAVGVDLIKQKDFRFLITVAVVSLWGFLLGSLPWWIYAMDHGVGGLIGELLGEAVAVEREPYAIRSFNHLIYFFLFGMPAAIGLRPPWDIQWLGLPLIPFVLFVWGKILWSWFKNGKKTGYEHILSGVMAVFTAGFVFTSFGVDPSGRYFLPLWVIFSLIGGKILDGWIMNQPRSFALVGLIVLFNLWGNMQCALKNPPGITTQFYAPARVDMRAMPELIEFLENQGETRGYSNYWVAYPLAFLTEENIIFTPRFPYHPDLRYAQRDDRYPLYTQWVEESDKVALITSHNPALDEILRQLLLDKGIDWDEERIGDFLIYYNLSAPIRIGDFEKYFIQ